MQDVNEDTKLSGSLIISTLIKSSIENKNTVDFGYWIGGSGMGELIMEQNRRRISLRQWQREA